MMKHMIQPWGAELTKKKRVFNGLVDHFLGEFIFLAGMFGWFLKMDGVSSCLFSSNYFWSGWRGVIFFKMKSCFFPTCHVRVVRFYVSCASSFLLPPSSSPDLICQLLIAVGLAMPRRISTASSWSQLALAGPHLPALDRSGPRRTSTASSWSQWASPDLNRRESEGCGPRRTSTARKKGHIECQRECQIECQIECQKICQIECQKISR